MSKPNQTETLSRSEYWKAYKDLVPPPERKFRWNGKGHAKLIREFVQSTLSNSEPKFEYESDNSSSEYSIHSTATDDLINEFDLTRLNKPAKLIYSEEIPEAGLRGGGVVRSKKGVQSKKTTSYDIPQEPLDQNALNLMFYNIKNNTYPNYDSFSPWLTKDQDEWLIENLKTFAPKQLRRFTQFVNDTLAIPPNEEQLDKIIIDSDWGSNMKLHQWEQLNKQEREYIKNELNLENPDLELLMFSELKRRREARKHPNKDQINNFIKRILQEAKEEVINEEYLKREEQKLKKEIIKEKKIKFPRKPKEEIPLTKDVSVEEVKEVESSDTIRPPKNKLNKKQRIKYYEKQIKSEGAFNTYEINGNTEDYETLLIALYKSWDSTFDRDHKLIVRTLMKVNEDNYEQRLMIFDRDSLFEHVQNLKNYYDKVLDQSEEITSKTEVIKRLATIEYLRVEPLSDSYESIYKRRFGAFNKWTHTFPMDLRHLGIYTKEQIKGEKFEESCLIKALEPQMEEEKKGLLDDLRMMFGCLEFLLKDLHLVADTLGGVIQVKFQTKGKKWGTTKYYGKKYRKEEDVKMYYLGLVNEHYFRNDEAASIKMTPYAMNNYDNLKCYKDWYKIQKLRKNGNPRKTNKLKVEAYKVVKWLNERSDLIEDINGFDLDINFDQLNKVKEDKEKVFLNPENVEKQETYRKKKLFKGKPYDVCFFDFETSTKEWRKNIEYKDPHRIFKSLRHRQRHQGISCAWSLDNGNTFGYKEGEDCAIEMLEQLKGNTLLIAHNITYDLSQIYEYLEMCDRIIWFNNSLMQGEFKYKKKDGTWVNLVLKDSCSVLQMKLSQFPETFNLKETEKEVIPYEMYTVRSMKRNYLELDIAKLYLDPEDFRQFEKTLIEREWIIEEATWKGNVRYFKHREYLKYYCVRDVEILAKSWTVFRDWISEFTEGEMNIDAIPSAASFAHQYYLSQGAYEKVVKLNGFPAQFIRECVVGGRVATWENKKIKVREGNVLVDGKFKDPIHKHATSYIVDDDVNSLYPSAIVRLEGYLKGAPKIIDDEHKSYKWLEKYTDGYFVEIKITKVGKHRGIAALPLRMKNSKGAMCNVYDDKLWVGNKMKVDKTGLEDLVKFHQIEFTVERGYYYNEGRNKRSTEITQHLYNTRLKYKKLKNPIQNVYKLVMNSAYGKTIMKPVQVSTKFFNTKEAMLKYYSLNYKSIKEAIQLGNTTKWRLEVLNKVNKFASYPQVGSEILSVSKRIMNEVMYLAEDNGMYVFYQDTDSMHLFKDDLQTLEQLYRDTYGKEMHGKGLGQFSSDFKVPRHKAHLKEKNYEPVAIEATFCGKKIYQDIIQINSKGDTFTHARMKGISESAIKYCKDYKITREENIKRKRQWTELDIYNKIYSGKTVGFDLLCGGSKVKFKKHKNLDYSNVWKFPRFIRC